MFHRRSPYSMRQCVRMRQRDRQVILRQRFFHQYPRKYKDQWFGNFTDYMWMSLEYVHQSVIGVGLKFSEYFDTDIWLFIIIQIAGEPIMVHRKRNWYRGRNDGDSTSGHYQRQQGSQRSYDFHKDDNVKSYCELCGEINHITQQCRHRNPISCHKCQRFGHKMKFCNWYRWIFGHGSHKTSRISDVDSIVDSCHCGNIADATCRTYLNINSRDNFIQASPRIEDCAPRVDIKCVNVDYEGWVSYLLGRNFFWSVLEKRDVPEDGHCFIQSLISSLSTLSPDLPCLSYDHVLTMITNEINLNSETYSSLLHDHANSKVNEMINEYINNKNYDEHFGDLVPIITANAINNDLVIIKKHKNGLSYEYINSNQSKNSYKRPLFLLRQGLNTVF